MSLEGFKSHRASGLVQHRIPITSRRGHEERYEKVRPALEIKAKVTSWAV